jgi:hypothetical protein
MASSAPALEIGLVLTITDQSCIRISRDVGFSSSLWIGTATARSVAMVVGA